VLVSRASITHGKKTFRAIYEWVSAQDVWTQRYPEHGPPGERVVRDAWLELNPATVDLCANIDVEAINRTAAEERRAAIDRWRETVNRWYGMERELVVERDALIDGNANGKELRHLEERLALAQHERLAAERELAEATSVIDDESFASLTLRSEVIAILARNRHEFTVEECERIAAIFAVEAEPQVEHDPDVPDYLQ
jgi:hypothetical protein